ncbi:penicillin-binding protein, partial [Lactobacillus sp. XV13L]|nr:penicillin-binding protein [Lactobacillus sp. XV13L]
GKSYEQLFRATYVQPLGLKHTEFLWSKPSKIIASQLVPGMIYRAGHYSTVKHQVALRDAHSELGAGSVVMSNHDLAKVLHYILAGKLLSRKSRKLLYEAQPPSYYNGGLYHDEQLKVKTANGAGEGYYTFMRTTDDAKTMIIIQTNKTRMGQFGWLKRRIDQIMQRLLGHSSE